MKDKGWMHEKCNTNTPPKSIPEQSPNNNSLEMNLVIESAVKSMIKDELHEQVMKDKFKELNKLNEETIYRDIYCEKETTPEMRKKIEEIYPHFKEQYAKSIKQSNGEELKDIPVKTNKRKREFKYYDIINLIGHIVDHKIQRHILEERKERAVWPRFQEPIIDKIKELDKKYLNWLEEEV